jgi:hypothetical protein
VTTLVVLPAFVLVTVCVKPRSLLLVAAMSRLLLLVDVASAPVKLPSRSLSLL